MHWNSESSPPRSVLRRRALDCNQPAGGETTPAGLLLPASDPDAGLVVRQAMGIWMSTVTQAKPEFLGTLKERFGTTAETLDFAKAGEAAAHINAWAGEQTAGKIP